MERKIIWSREFTRDLKKIGKRSHSIDKDVERFQKDFENRRLPGDTLRGVRGLPIKEHRMRDSSSNRGKSGGFRVFYYYDEYLIMFILVVRRSQLQRLELNRIFDILKEEGFIQD